MQSRPTMKSSGKAADNEQQPFTHILLVWPWGGRKSLTAFFTQKKRHRLKNPAAFLIYYFLKAYVNPVHELCRSYYRQNKMTDRLSAEIVLLT